MPSYRYKQGDNIGGYRLLSHLGCGGHSEVWKAERDGSQVAIKLVQTLDPKSKAYLRFRDEVGVMGKLNDRDGVLPLLDASVPATPTKGSPGWLVTPVATPIRKALDKASLDEVIAAGVQLSGTLAELAAEGYAHRDIKHENLFLYDGHYVLGDFGLVDYPGKQDLSGNSPKLGPIHVIAPEMTQSPPSDCRPADVYSLAKTLWILATGQTFAPPGYQPAGSPGFRISDYVVHDRAASLDALIDRATRFQPEERPTMKELHSELMAWTAGPSEPRAPGDLSAVVRHVTAATQPGRRQSEALDEYKKQADLQTVPVRRELQAIAERIANAGLEATAHYGGVTPSLWGRGKGPRHPDWTYVFNVETKTYSGGPVLWSTIYMELHGGDIYIMGAHTITVPDSVNGSREHEVWSERKKALVGTPGHENAVAELLGLLSENLERSLATLPDISPS